MIYNIIKKWSTILAQFLTTQTILIASDKTQLEINRLTFN